MVRKVLIFVVILLYPCIALAQTISFQWDPHPEAAAIAGFKLFQAKQSGNYGAAPVAIFVGGSLTSGTINKPSSPGRYYWVLKAYMPDPAQQGVDIESLPSNEVTDVIKPKEPTGLARIVAAISGAIKKLFTSDKGLRIQ